MERWGAKGAAPEPGRARRYADQPSFSSTLLDAIYKSMDETDDGAAAEALSNNKKRDEALHYGYYYKPSLAGSYRASRAPGPHATTSSSSDCSSYGGFSSSEAESSQHRRLRPIRTSVAGGGAPAPAPEKKAKKAAAGAAIRAKLRDLRKPASPGARLAGFLNSIFAGRRGPATPPSSASRAGAAESACSTASSYSRSCLSKTPSTRGQPRRTVRFLESDDADKPPAAPASAERRRVQVGAMEQMLLRRMEMESDDDDDDDEEDEESSDASSDLFELENLAAIAPAAGGAAAAAYRDELPVYETTRVVLNRGIGHAHGHGYAAHGRSTRVV